MLLLAVRVLLLTLSRRLARPSSPGAGRALVDLLTRDEIGRLALRVGGLLGVVGSPLFRHLPGLRLGGDGRVLRVVLRGCAAGGVLLLLMLLGGCGGMVLLRSGSVGKLRGLSLRRKVVRRLGVRYKHDEGVSKGMATDS